MSQATELIAQQYLNAAINKNTWGNILFNVKTYNAVGDGSDDTLSIQNTINAAIAAGVKAVFFPHGNYVASALTGLTQVVLLGDNATLTVGGSSIPITQLGAVPLSNLSRQAIINGNFDVWQRGTNFAANTSYTVDRWALYHDHTSVSVSQQETFLPDGSRYIARLTNTVRGTGSYFKFSQAIETMNCLALIGKTVTLSFKVRKNSVLTSGNLVAKVTYTTTINDSGLSTVNGTSAGSKTTSSATLTTEFQTITVTAVIPSSARTIGVQFDLNNSPTDGGYVEISQVQVNAGDKALPFQPSSFAEELALCQRYYEKSYNITTNPATTTSSGLENMYVGASVPAPNSYGSIRFKVKKRATPTITIYPYATPTNTGRVSDNAGVDQAASSGSTQYVGDVGFSIFNASAGTLTPSGSAIIFHWAADAEL